MSNEQHYPPQPIQPSPDDSKKFLNMSGGLLMLVITGVILVCCIGPFVICLAGGIIGEGRRGNMSMSDEQPVSRQDRVKALEEANTAALKSLQAQGVQIDPSVFVGIRTTVLTDCVFGMTAQGVATGGAVDRWDYEQRAGEAIAAALAQIAEQLAGARLRAGVAHNGLIIPGH